MITRRTVFVVGAGASAEAKMPVGSALKGIISTKLDLRFEAFARPVGKGDLAIFEALHRKYPAVNTYLEACWRIRDGVVLSGSIDDYLDAHQDDAEAAVCGKLAIAKSILEAERGSNLFYERRNVNDSIDFQGLGNTWYPRFYQLLSQGVTKETLSSIFKYVTVITFNYDRCVEHFLCHALSTNYHISVGDARLLVQTLPIHHVYGSVGKYFGSGNEIVDFGSAGLPNVDAITKNVRTYCERVDDDVSIQALKGAMLEADVLVFLGNAFHKSNMKLLEPELLVTSSKTVYATREGISNDDLTVICQRYLSPFAGKSSAGNYALTGFKFAGTCSELFDEYRASLRG
jgi:hypothetical protein